MSVGNGRTTSCLGMYADIRLSERGDDFSREMAAKEARLMRFSRMSQQCLSSVFECFSELWCEASAPAIIGIRRYPVSRSTCSSTSDCLGIYKSRIATISL